MSKNNLITVCCFGLELGRLGFDENRAASFFQYNEAFLQDGRYTRMFPLLLRRIKPTQVFDQYNNDTFRALAPVFADSLPDLFGNIIFRAWMDSTHQHSGEISVLEQLAYVGRRGTRQRKSLPASTKTHRLNATVTNTG